MLVHNICITGYIQHLNTDFVWRQRKIKFYDNSIVLKKGNYQLCLTKNIRSVLLLPNLKLLFKRRLELEFQREIRDLDFKIGNIHHSCRINFNSRNLLKSFIPLLQKNFPIDDVSMSQEQNTPVHVTVRNLLEAESYTFLAITLKVVNNSVTIRLQVDKTKAFTHCTIILTRFSSKTRELVKFFIERQLKAQDVSN